jgi:hypothetical protein
MPPPCHLATRLSCLWLLPLPHPQS